jgi:hypothetical protein
MSPVRRRRALTLVELLVGVLVAALVAGAAGGVLSQQVRAESRAHARREAFERAVLGADLIARDLMNAVRHEDLSQARLRIVRGGTDREPRDEVLVLARAVARVRPAAAGPEGGQIEVQYRIAPVDVAPGVALWRRADPGLDRFQDAGGVAAPVVPGAAGLRLEAGDGVSWFDGWDSDELGLPHAVRILVRAQSDDGRAGAWARRVVALDRVPVPPRDDGTEGGS